MPDSWKRQKCVPIDFALTMKDFDKRTVYMSLHVVNLLNVSAHSVAVFLIKSPRMSHLLRQNALADDLVLLSRAPVLCL